MPVALKVGIVISFIAVFAASSGNDEGSPAEHSGKVTVMVPVAFTLPQPPVKGMVYVKLPSVVGVPFIVILFADHEAMSPVGKPFASPIPVAPVVVLIEIGSSMLMGLFW
jgi:hypothetical protein